jgi:hypothetical protein
MTRRQKERAAQMNKRKALPLADEKEEVVSGSSDNNNGVVR